MKAFYDLNTNDFPRIIKEGKRVIDTSFDDIYIPCRAGNYIMHHQGNILIAIVKTVQKGHNVIKQLYEDKFGENTSSGVSYEDLYSQLSDEGIIVKVEETDKEMLIYFTDNYMNKFAKILKPSTNGAKTSPFSVDNLPKTKYKIPEKDKTDYDNIVSKLDNKLVTMSKYNSEFLEKVNNNYKADMKKTGIKGGKEYIHSIGKWTEYLDYLKMRIK